MNLKFSPKDIYIWAGVFVICYNQLLNIVGIPVTYVIGSNSIDTAMVVALYFLTVGYTLLSSIHCLPRSILFIGVPIGLILYTSMIYPANYEFMQKDMQAIVGALIAFSIMLIVVRNELLKDTLYRIGYVSFVYTICIFLVKTHIINIPEADVSYMEFGYYVLPAMIILFCKYNEQKQRKDIIFMILSMVIAFIYGSRGSVFAGILFIATYRLLINGIRSKRMYTTFGVGLIGYLLLSSRSFIIVLSDIAYSLLGYNPRTLEKILDNTIFSDSGRNLMFEPAKKIISDNWVFGAGPYADRALIYFDSNDSASRGVGHYMHNILYEMLIDFGVPLTILLIIFFVVAFVKIMDSHRERKVEYLCFVSLWFFKLMMSGSFWTEVWFWSWFAVLFEMLRLKKMDALNFNYNYDGWSTNGKDNRQT